MFLTGISAVAAVADRTQIHACTILVVPSRNRPVRAPTDGACRIGAAVRFLKRLHRDCVDANAYRKR
jgi:hypothetical protein